MVENIAQNMAELLVNQPIDDDDLKVTLCIFEIQHFKVDFCNYEIVQRSLSLEREPRGIIAYENILHEIANLETEVRNYRESLELRSCLRTIQRLTNGSCTHVVDVQLMVLIKHKILSIWLIEN